MPDDANNAIQRIYEGTPLTVKANIPTGDASSVEEVTFKFCKDGEQFEEKTGAVSAVHTVPAPDVPDDQESYFLEYHVFYTVKNSDGATETHQNLSAKKLEVVPRTAQLKATWDKDGEPFHNFQFKVVQRGEQVGEIKSTFANDTQNAKDETIPAGTAEFNLDLIPGFQIVQQSPFEITEYVVMDGRKREVKGELKFRAVFVAPERGDIQQYVNCDTENMGRDGLGHEVFIEVGAHPDDEEFLRGNDDAEVHFRVTYGPDDSSPVTKSARNDTDNPTKVLKPSEQDTDVTIEEKEANKKYEGSVKLTGGTGIFKVGLGVAGGDTCTVEIAGSDKFLTDDGIAPDDTLEFENWRRVHYELMVPDIIVERGLELTEGEKEAEGWNLPTPVLRCLETLSREIFIEFVPDATHVFDTLKQPDYKTLLPRSFLGQEGEENEEVYVLSGRNWRDLPADKSWLEEHPGKTLYITVCDALLKWRKDADDPQKGTADFSGKITEATGFIDIEKNFQGLFMPFSGYDGEDGIADLAWTADISKADDVCKYTLELELEEERYPDAPSEKLEVRLEGDENLPALPTSIAFNRPSAEGVFESEISDSKSTQIQAFVNELLDDHELLYKVEAKVKVLVVCPENTDHGEDDCFNAVNDKLRELFDSTKEEFSFHPGLDVEGEPRAGSYLLGEISDVDKGNFREWHFVLPDVEPDGTPGIGSFIGTEKTADKCPVNIEFSVQAHEASDGECEGRRLAWVYDASAGSKQLVRLVLQGFEASEDAFSLAHGHGDDGMLGDCLVDSDSLCTVCVEHGRSKDLTVI